MSAHVRVLNETAGEAFSAEIDEETDLWVASAVDPQNNEHLTANLNVMAPFDGDYSSEIVENWYGDNAAVLRPYGYERAMRLRSYFPDIQIIVFFNDEGDRDLVY